MRSKDVVSFRIIWKNARAKSCLVNKFSNSLSKSVSIRIWNRAQNVVAIAMTWKFRGWWRRINLYGQLYHRNVAVISSRFSRAVDLTAREAIRLNYLKTTSKTFLENVKILENVLGWLYLPGSYLALMGDSSRIHFSSYYFHKEIFVACCRALQIHNGFAILCHLRPQRAQKCVKCKVVGNLSPTDYLT